VHFRASGYYKALIQETVCCQWNQSRCQHSRQSCVLSSPPRKSSIIIYRTV